jgi:hypothetical protein
VKEFTLMLFLMMDEVKETDAPVRTSAEDLGLGPAARGKARSLSAFHSMVFSRAIFCAIMASPDG